jgi:hypothetical protein
VQKPPQPGAAKPAQPAQKPASQKPPAQRPPQMPPSSGAKSAQNSTAARAPTLPYAEPGTRVADAADHVGGLPPPPPTPREITPAVWRRSWLEPRVRFWWLCSIALMFISGWFLTDQIREYFRENRLITSGALVQATISEISGAKLKGQAYSRDTPCTLEFTLNGQDVILPDVVLSSLGNYISPKDVITIHVNPNDTSEWTDRTQPEALGRRMIAGIVILPVLAATIASAILLRRRIIRTWRDGIAAAFSVEAVGHSALAPLSYAVRCAPFEQRSRRLVTVFLPPRVAKPVIGDVLWLIHPWGKTEQSIAAAAYENPARPAQ